MNFEAYRTYALLDWDARTNTSDRSAPVSDEIEVFQYPSMHLSLRRYALFRLARNPVPVLPCCLELGVHLRDESLRGFLRIRDLRVVIGGRLGGEHFVLALALIEQLRHAIADRD